MAKGTFLSRIGAQGHKNTLPQLSKPALTGAPTATATIKPAVLTTKDTVVPAPTRVIAEAVAVPSSISRDARILARPQIDEARIINPQLFERLGPIKFRPIPFDLPGCPAGGEHDHGSSANYTITVNRAGVPGQANWRWCRKCQGMVFGGHEGGVCVKGGKHDLTQSADYVLQHGVAPAGHQTNWRWCRKCDGLAYGGGTGVCPAGGAHDHSGSGDYALAIDQPEAEGQPNWRWCAKCQALAYTGGPVGASREELGLPVAASDPVEDNKVFEAASGPERYHLGHYRLARRVVSGSEQYRIRMAAGEDGVWTLEVALDRIRPEGVPDDTLELDHELLLQLTYRLTTSDGSTVPKTLDFTEVGETEDGTLVVARLRFTNPAERDQVLAAITTSGSGAGLIATRSVRVAAPIAGSPDRYRPVTRGLRQAVEPDPLFLNTTLHPYLYDGAIPTGSGPGLVMKQIRYGGRFHSYWVDATDPAHVYYLPDEFRLTRQGKPAPFSPLMTVRPVPGETPDAEPLMMFEFVATPWVDLDRLESAKHEFVKALPQPKANGVGAPTPSPTPTSTGLGDLLGEVLGWGVGKLLGVSREDERAALIRLEPLPVDNASFWLALPGASGGGLVERSAAQIDIRTAVITAETLRLADFQTIYVALLGGAVAIMKGEIRAELRPGEFERIPFDGRFDRMNGELMTATVTDGDQPGHFTIQLTNAIESPLEVTTLAASLLTGEIESDATMIPGAPLPQRLAPGESLTVTVTPKTPFSGPLPIGLTVEPLLDFAGVRVVPDREAIWNTIFDTSTAVETRRTVHVKLYPFMFDAPSGEEAERAMAVIVQFESGTSVELTPDKLEGEVSLSAPIGDLVLRHGNVGGYRYKTQIIRRSSRPVDAEWRSDNADLLIPLLPEG